MVFPYLTAIAAFFIMNDYPATAKFLTVAEKEEVTRRLEQDRSALADEFSMVYFKDAMKDWKIWVHMVSLDHTRTLHIERACTNDIVVHHHRSLHPSILLLPLPPHHRQRTRIHQRDGTADDCTPLHRGLRMLHRWRLVG